MIYHLSSKEKDAQDSGLAHFLGDLNQIKSFLDYDIFKLRLIQSAETGWDNNHNYVNFWRNYKFSEIDDFQTQKDPYKRNLFWVFLNVPSFY